MLNLSAECRSQMRLLLGYIVAVVAEHIAEPSQLRYCIASSAIDYHTVPNAIIRNVGLRTQLVSALSWINFFTFVSHFNCIFAQIHKL